MANFKSKKIALLGVIALIAIGGAIFYFGSRKAGSSLYYVSELRLYVRTEKSGKEPMKIYFGDEKNSKDNYISATAEDGLIKCYYMSNYGVLYFPTIGQKVNSLRSEDIFLSVFDPADDFGLTRDEAKEFYDSIIEPHFETLYGFTFSDKGQMTITRKGKRISYETLKRGGE